jgi:hypothetical protein
VGIYHATAISFNGYIIQRLYHLSDRHVCCTATIYRPTYIICLTHGALSQTMQRLYHATDISCV